ncbi:helicase and polymerase-containing protein TEBICHI isoform X2 [Physcomitrium patens]|uniref:DNA-directed DNA polymerase n=1 Tax=Physcomitrium patens TaxID=3218 RepID=A0A7I4BUF4_PHYPA|nr:helicase and polymerase-containing protein TEBICHI-like isoform X2 [Physcomitrium patens]|eukprot:XP_024380174.1 helicase and polymerase-containing protein TEBICHI-like isoform X2 [Physcomitrella patens]
MQKPSKRLDQTYPSRKVMSNGFLASQKLDIQSPEIEKENHEEGSTHHNGISDVYLATRGNTRIGLKATRKEFAGNSRVPSLTKGGDSNERSATDSWLNRCRPGVSQFVPTRGIGPGLKGNKSCESIRAETAGGPITDTFYHQVFDDALIDESAEKRVILDEDFRDSKKQKLDSNSEDAFVACTPLKDITNSRTGSMCSSDQQRDQRITVSQRSFWINDHELCATGLPCDVTRDQTAEEVQFMEEKQCISGRWQDVDCMLIEKKVDAARHLGLSGMPSKKDGEIEAQRSYEEFQNRGNTPTFEVVAMEGVFDPLEPMSPQGQRIQTPGEVDTGTFKSDVHLNVIPDSPADEGCPCWTPSPGSCKILEDQPSGVSKPGEWQSNGLSFSPGDAFWDEAFEAVNGILVPNSSRQPPENSSPVRQISLGMVKDMGLMKVNGRFDSQVLKTKEVEQLIEDVRQSILEEENAGKSVLASEHGAEIDNSNDLTRNDEFGGFPLPADSNVFTNDSSLSKSKVNPTPSLLATVPRLQSVESLAEVDQFTHSSSGVPSTSYESLSAFPKGVAIERENENFVVSKLKTLYKSELCKWLPPELCSFFAKKGLTKLYQWQVECLQTDGVLDGRNLVYCASTSAGKSLVAELLMLRRVLSTGKKALLVLPYVTLCSEKANHLQALLQPLGKQVRGFYGTQGGSSLPQDTSVAVCTIEKANSLVNKLLEEGRLSEISMIVIDELHMVGDKDRGYLLELLLTKLRYAAGCGDLTSDFSAEGWTNSNIKWSTELQIVGMSATMPNVSEVAKWLQAALYQTEFRPIPLEEFMKVGNTIFDKSMEIVRMIRDDADLGGKDPDHIIELCHEVVSEGHSVLVFCSSRKGCETSARHIAKHLPPFSVIKKNSDGPEDGNAAVEELRRCSAGLDPVLADTVPAGVAYHHAGLTAEEKDVIETCFKSGVVRVLVATSTLAAGVNLPARRVIFRQPKIGRDFVDTTRYRQMAGRAGRAGIDTKGESILICKPEEAKRIMEMMKQDCKALQSCLADDKNGMMRALLEVVASGMVKTAADVQRYVRCTLLNATQPFEEVVKAAQDSLRWLCHKHLVEWDKNAEIYNITPLGRAAFSSSLSPEESLVVFEDLAKAREGFVLASDLHLIYEVTPTYVDLEPDWGVFYQRYMELSPIDQAVGSRVGVLEAFLLRMAHGAPILQHRTGVRSRGGKDVKGKVSPLAQKSRWKSPNGAQLPVDQLLRICKRFHVALILSYLVQEVPMMEICERFKVQKGVVQGLQESAGRFAGMVAAFCERLGWSDMGTLVDKFQKRVSFGVKSEIVELTEIPFVKAARARALFKAGLKSIHAVAEATVDELVNALFCNSSWNSQDDNGPQWSLVGVARKIKHGARQIALERAEESRAAAFSACQALGVQVNAGLALPLVGAINDEA